MSFSPEVWGFVGVAFGAVITIITTVLNNRASAKQVKVQLQHQERESRSVKAKERLEELYELTTVWESIYLIDTQYIARLISKSIGIDAYMRVIEHSLERDKDITRISMICEIYGGVLNTDRIRLIRAIREFDQHKEHIEKVCLARIGAHGEEHLFFEKNLTEPVPRLIEAVLGGFAGFKSKVAELARDA